MSNPEKVADMLSAEELEVRNLVHAELRDKANQYALLVTRCHALGMSEPRLAIMALLEEKLWELVREHGPVKKLSTRNLITPELQARADYNRDNAKTLYGDVLYYGYNKIGYYYMPGTSAVDKSKIRWRELATDKPVVFTPYGWRLEEEVAGNA